MQAPFIELSFYSEMLMPRELFIQILELLLENGVIDKNKLSEIMFSTGNKGITEKDIQHDIIRLWELINKHNVQYLYIDSSKLFGSQQIMLLRLENSESKISNGSVVSISMSDIVFEPVWLHEGESDFNSVEQESIQIGMTIFKLFISMVNKIIPSYAAIGVEYRIYTPEEYRATYMGWPSGNFYINKGLFDRGSLSRIVEMFSKCYIEDLGHGYYLSCDKYFNPKQVVSDCSEIKHVMCDIIANLIQ